MTSNGAYDVFGGDWGLGLPISWFDAAAIESLLTATLTGQSQIDQLVLGWDGEPVEVWEVVRALLRCKGYFPGYTSTGLLTFARARLATVLDIATSTTVTPIPRTLREEPSEGDGVDRVEATYGATPWFDGEKVTVNILSDADSTQAANSLRAGLFADRNSVELDMSPINPPDLQNAALELVPFVMMRGLNRRKLFVRANDPGTINIGDIVKLGDPALGEAWFTDADGNTVAVDSTARWYGQVVGFKRNLMDASIDLELQMNVDEFARVRAPSAVVVSDSTNVYTCDEDVFFGPLGGGTDVEQFTVGDEVELWTPDGVRRSGTAASPDVQVVDSIGTNTLTLDAAFTTTPTAGDIIRLAHMSDANGFPDSDSDLVSGYNPFVYSADTTPNLGPDGVDAHIYGFGTL